MLSHYGIKLSGGLGKTHLSINYLMHNNLEVLILDQQNYQKHG